MSEQTEIKRAMLAKIAYLTADVDELRTTNAQLEDHARNIGPRRLAKWVKHVETLQGETNQLMRVLTKIVNEWDQYFDAEGPLQPDGGYRFSSSIAADAIDEARLLLKSARPAQEAERTEN